MFNVICSYFAFNHIIKYISGKTRPLISYWYAHYCTSTTAFHLGSVVYISKSYARYWMQETPFCPPSRVHTQFGKYGNHESFKNIFPGMEILEKWHFWVTEVWKIGNRAWNFTGISLFAKWMKMESSQVAHPRGIHVDTRGATGGIHVDKLVETTWCMTEKIHEFRGIHVDPRVIHVESTW